MNKLLKYSLFLIGLFFILLCLFAYSPDRDLKELKTKYTNSFSSFVSIAGCDVHYRIEGRGHPMILLHGTGASLHTWDAWTELLKDSFQIFRFDLPGFGLTGPNQSRDYSIETYVQFVDAMVDFFGLDSLYLAGNSLGGHIAWEYALLRPEKVRKLILVDASGYPFDRNKALAFRIARNPVLRPFLKRFLPRSFVKKNLEEVFGNPQKITEDLIDRYYELSLRPGNRKAFIDRALTDEVDNSWKIKEIQCETLIIWGDKDRWVNPEDARRFDQDIPRSKLFIMEGLGHIPMEEDPSNSVKEVRKFLSGTG